MAMQWNGPLVEIYRTVKRDDDL